MHPYDQYFPTLTEHTQRGYGESKGGAVPTNITKNQEVNCNSFNRKNNNNSNSCTLSEQGSDDILSENKQDSSPQLLSNIIAYIGAGASNSDSNSSWKSVENEEEFLDQCNILKRIRVSNINKLVIAQLNINSLRNKFEDLKIIIRDNIDILIINESKPDDSFPSHQFFIDGYSSPLRLDRDSNRGGVIIYVREDIPCKELKLKGNEIPQKINLREYFLK